jgi:outer membrane protein
MDAAIIAQGKPAENALADTAWTGQSWRDKIRPSNVHIRAGTVVVRRDGMDKIEVLLVWLVAACIAPVCAYPGPGSNVPAIAFEDLLSLQRCLEIAVDNSNQIAITEGDVLKAEMGLKDAWSGFLPELHLSGGYNLTDRYNRFEWNENHYSLSLGASVSPFNGGRNFINTAKSRESLASAKQSLRLTETNLALEVMSKYYNLLEASEILKLRKESLAQKRTHFEFARAQFDLGLVPRSDVLKAEVAVVAGEVDSLEADGNVGLAHAELNDAMGISLDHPTRIKPVMVTREAPPSAEECLDEALKNRPELLQQKSSLAIRKHNLKLARLERWPKLTISGSYNAYVDRFVFDGLPVNRTNWEDNTDWRAGIGLSFPIFDGGVTRRAVRAARIDLKESELSYSDWEKQVNLEVKSAHLSLVTALRRIDLTEKEVESAQESYNAALGRYRTGVAPITEAIDAAVALSNSRVTNTRAIYDYLLARAWLSQAMGRLPYQAAGRSQ